MNLSDLPTEEQKKIEAFKILCFLRWQARTGKISWREGKARIDRLPEPTKTYVLEIIERERNEKSS